MSYSNLTHLSVIDQRRALLSRELDEIRSARGLPSEHPKPTLVHRGEALRRRLAAAVARVRASGRPGAHGRLASVDAVSADGSRSQILVEQGRPIEDREHKGFPI